MKRLLWLLAATVVLTVADTGRGGPVLPFKVETPQIPQLASQTYTLEFRGGQRANVMAIGNAATYIGVYIYDRDGNCVAWDDWGMPISRDDIAVDWYPQQTAPYMVEVRNNGIRVNGCKVVIR